MKRPAIILSIIFLLLLLGYTLGFIRLRYNHYGLAELEVFYQKIGLTSTFDDGPYMIEEKGKWYRLNIVAGQAQRSPLTEAPPVVSRPPAVFEGVEHIAVVSDIHGQYELLVQLLQANGIIDQAKNWAFAEGHLVILGDIFDRGHAVTECMWLIYELQQQAEERGGRVHYVLGNHELMVLKGDLAFTNPKYRKAAEILGIPYSELYAGNTQMGQWLRTRPAMLKINDYLFVHGGISAAVADQKWDIEEINRLYYEALDSGKEGEAYSLLLGPAGLLWYRGFLKDKGYGTTLKAILRQYGATAMVCGHTTFSHIEERYEGTLYLVDAGMKYGRQGEMLRMDDDLIRAYDQNGDPVEIVRN